MEPAKNNMPPLIAGGVAFFIIIGAAVYLMYFYSPSASEIPEIDAGPDVTAEVSGAVKTPAEELPETNPFKGYKNPFE